MPKFRYRAIPSNVEAEYTRNTERDISESLGQVDFTKAELIVDAETPEESEKIRMGITDIRMWELIED